MKKNITIAVLAIVAAVLLYFLLREGKQYDSHTTDNDLIKTDNKILQEQRNAGLKLIDSLQGDVAKRDTLINDLQAQLSGTRRDLDKSTSKAVHLANEIKAMKRDTTEHDRKCDSLASEALNYAWLYQQYKDFSDSLTVAVSKNEGDYKAALSEQKKLYDSLYSKYEQLYRLYDQLFKDYTGARKSLKREKLKTKVAALLALVAGGAAVIK